VQFSKIDLFLSMSFSATLLIYHINKVNVNNFIEILFGVNRVVAATYITISGLLWIRNPFFEFFLEKLKRMKFDKRTSF
ncbi:hypothetical protein, partial [Pseudalkalibacillus sp. NRS-1564]|uniref:hypothetical protein n=1 Tax=Pseudalkalibacillus sp. NRS-1564 TaxID=3233900 RepID=UPI003D2A9A55